MRLESTHAQEVTIRRDIVAVFVAALLVRLVYTFTVYPHFAAQFASDGYDEIALNLVSGNGYTRAGVSAAAERLPLYPMMLAFCFRVFGPHAWPWQILQALLGAGTCVVVYRVARSLAVRSAALGAAVFCSIHPTLLLYTPRPLTETLYIALLVVFVEQLLRRRAALSGALLGMQLLIKSTAALHLLGLLVLWGRDPFLQSTHPPRAATHEPMWRAITRALVIAVLVVAPWVAWNLINFGRAHLFSATGGWALYHGLYISRHVDWRTPAADLNRDAELALWDDLAKLGIARDADVTLRDAVAGNLARRWISEHPTESMRLFVRNLVLTWYLGRSRASMLLHALLHVPLLIAAAFGIRQLWSASVAMRVLALTLAAIVVAYSAFHAAVQPAVRYILPAVPLAAILAAAAWPNYSERHSNAN